MSLFITFEGADGSGKSTQVARLESALSGRSVLSVREPGGTPLGEAVRELVLAGTTMSGEAEMHLFMAARSELLRERILPSLARGEIVIADRYHDSTLAYQGGGRGVETHWPGWYPRPDVTFLVELPVELALARLRDSGRRLDRLDSETEAFHAAVSAAYSRLAEGEPPRWVRLDGSLDPDRLHAQVMQHLAARLETVPA